MHIDVNLIIGHACNRGKVIGSVIVVSIQFAKCLARMKG